MKLWEIDTDFIGESYERCYVWCQNEEEARRMFVNAHPNRDIKKISGILLMFDEKDPAFITELSDCGFGENIKNKSL